MRAAVTVRRPAVLLAVAPAAGAAVIAGPAVGRPSRIPGRHVGGMGAGGLPGVRHSEACS